MSGVSVSPSPLEFLQSNPAGPQSQILSKKNFLFLFLVLHLASLAMYGVPQTEASTQLFRPEFV